MDRYPCKWYPFAGHPESDSCWSLSVGPDGRIYAAACCELVPGATVQVTRYNEQTDSLDYLCELDKLVEDPRDSGRATQCKIHYSFAPSMADSVLYMASHLSGPPIDQPSYSPWNSWHDPERCFRGSALLAWDTKSDRALWWKTLIPKEGCRCLAHDEERRKLYAVSYPRDHFYVYDLDTHKLTDVGRIGSVNSQAVFVDAKHRVWTSSDEGRLIRFDPDTGRLEASPYLLPHDDRFQTGWHSVFYDAAPAPDGESVFVCTWIAAPRLMRIRPLDGPWGSVEDLGPATQDRDTNFPICTFRDHCGGLVFAGDGQLYYVASRWRDPKYVPETPSGREKEGVVWRMDPGTGAREEVALLERPECDANYVSRGAVDHNGDLFFGHVAGNGRSPVGIFKVELPQERKRPDAHLPIRMWG